MSEFDKEAEREKLRRQYEQEQADRQATQQMSELLLRGATMTNNHCDVCGDPIFRYEGQEFCPTCRMEESAERPDDPGTQSASGRDASTEGARSASETPEPDQVERESTPESVDRTSSGSVDEPAVTPASDVTDHEGLEGARDALAETITGLARRAAAADDPRQAREYLEATTEAAETLRLLD